MVGFELVSITLNLLMLAIVLHKGGFVKERFSKRVIKTALWAMFALFIVNTVGNLLSVNEIEKLVFTPLTILLALFSFKLAISK